VRCEHFFGVYFKRRPVINLFVDKYRAQLGMKGTATDINAQTSAPLPIDTCLKQWQIEGAHRTQESVMQACHFVCQNNRAPPSLEATLFYPFS